MRALNEPKASHTTQNQKIPERQSLSRIILVAGVGFTQQPLAVEWLPYRVGSPISSHFVRLNRPTRAIEQGSRSTHTNKNPPKRQASPRDFW